MTTLILLAGSLAVAAAEEPGNLPRVLFFANPMGSDNDVIRRPKTGELSIAERQFQGLCKGIFDVTITQNGADLSKEALARYDAVVFFTAINPPGVDRKALVEWVEQGGAFVGIHSTANTYQGDPAFGAMLGAAFDRRPWRTKQAPQTKVRLKVMDPEHPATRHLPKTFSITDDIYQFKRFDPTQSRLLLAIDRESVDLSQPKMNQQDKVLPIAWARTHGKGRVFYTALGDWEPTWEDPRYRTHLIEGIRWTLKRD